MPELPEVHTIVTDLAPLISGQIITSAKYVGPLGQDLRRKSKSDLEVALVGKRVSGVERMAKQILIELDSSEYLNFHLKITGRLLWRKAGYKEDEFTRLVITLEDSELRFTDRNGYADADLYLPAEVDSVRDRYGPEALDEELTESDFFTLVSSSKEPSIKETLLNQKIISGVGNIYADEALFLAHLHPRLRPAQLTQSEARKLLESTRQVLREGIADRGTTIDSYVDVHGVPGKHQENLRVYSRTGQPCKECTGVVEYMEVGGRRTHYCPACQKLPQMSLFDV